MIVNIGYIFDFNCVVILMLNFVYRCIFSFVLLILCILSLYFLMYISLFIYDIVRLVFKILVVF